MLAMKCVVGECGGEVGVNQQHPEEEEGGGEERQGHRHPPGGARHAPPRHQPAAVAGQPAGDQLPQSKPAVVAPFPIPIKVA